MAAPNPITSAIIGVPASNLRGKHYKWFLEKYGFNHIPSSLIGRHLIQKF